MKIITITASTGIHPNITPTHSQTFIKSDFYSPTKQSYTHTHTNLIIIYANKAIAKHIYRCADPWTLNYGNNSCSRKHSDEPAAEQE